MQTETSPTYIGYLNQEIKPINELSLSVQDIGVLRGYGVFDYLRTYNGRPFHLMDHIERFCLSAQQIGLQLIHNSEEMADIVYDLLEKNSAAFGGDLNVGIRLLGTGGVSSNAFTPLEDQGGFAVLIEPLSQFKPEMYSDGVKLMTTTLTREFPTVKSTNYIGAIMAMNAATKAGAYEALYVDEAGEISECTRSNIFFVQDGRLLTPQNRILDGITRKVVLKLASNRVEVEVRPIFMHELEQIDEVFITSSTKEVMPVNRIDEIEINDGKIGPVTTQLLADFRAYASQVQG